MIAFCWPYFIKSDAFSPLPNDLGLPPNPKHIAQTIDDLPVPFGPTIKFNPGSQSIVVESNVTQFNKLIRTIWPNWYSISYWCGSSNNPLCFFIWY